MGHLVLGRRMGERILITDEETNDVIADIIVKEISRTQVKLGINAEREVGIHREEIYERIVNERAGDA